MTPILEIILCSFNFIAAFLAVILFIFTSLSSEVKRGFKRLPRLLRHYLIFSTCPSVIILSITSMIASACYIFLGDRINYSVIRMVLAFSGEQLRFSLLAMTIERIVATMYLEQYSKYSSAPWVLLIMVAISYFSSILYVIFLSTWIFVFTEKHVHYFINSIALAVHIAILIIGKVLRSKNMKMYALLTYQVSLKRRYQILENVKVLNFLYPKILIFTIIAPLGPLVALIFDLLATAPIPVGLFHLPYNCSFVLMGLYCLMLIRSRKRIHPVSGVEKNVFTIMSPLGNLLPVNIPLDHYFENLQRQWG